MTKQSNPKELYELLANAGFPKSYVRSLLPEWWEDEAANKPVGLAEFRLLLSRNLGVHLDNLSADTPKVSFALPHRRKLKRSIRYNESQLTPAISVALAAARVAAAACIPGYTALPSPAQLREFILSELGGRYVSLRGLIRAGWAHGIPILYLATFPDRMPKMDGLVALVSGRPVVVLSKRINFSAWMSFILAHELGHIWNGHVTENDILIDEAMDETNYKVDPRDTEENEADRFALQLLCGDLETSGLFSDLDEPRELADRALNLQREHQIDAGHLLLRFAFESGNWQLAVAALGVLDTEKRAISDLHTAMAHELALENVSESSRDFLLRATGAPDRTQ